MHQNMPAIHLLEKSLSIYQRLGDQAGTASALMEIGHQWHLLGEVEKGHVALQKAISLWRALGDNIRIAWSLMSFGGRPET